MDRLLGFLITLMKAGFIAKEVSKEAPVFAAGMLCAVSLAAFGAYEGIHRMVTPRSSVEVNLSKSRQQLIDSGVAGDKATFQKFMADQANEYFSWKGFRCDPEAPGKNIGETMARARCENAPAP